MNMFLQLSGGVAGLVLLYYGAEFLIKGGVSIALKLKVPALIIGLTLVAFGTSAPELVVSIDASLKGSGDSMFAYTICMYPFIHYWIFRLFLHLDCCE